MNPAPSNDPPAPFSCTYSPNLPELLLTLQCSLAVSTYQAGKLILLSPKNTEEIIQLPRTFQKPMGVALHRDGNTFSVATRDEVQVFKNSAQLAYHYPRKPATYDALFMPRLSYFTGPLDIHDLDWIGDELYAVNTLFSCIMRIDANFSFTPVWRPPYISKLAPEDRCHLNGMAVEGEKVRYVTAFSRSDRAGGWRENLPDTGIIMDTEANAVISAEVAMPHSPRIIEGRLVVLSSATGQVFEVSPKDGRLTEICRLRGFIRGMAYYRGYVFIGHSRLRKNSSSFGKLDIPDADKFAGIRVIHLATGAIVGELFYRTSVDEIYDVQVLPGLFRPNILNTLSGQFKQGLMTPDTTFWAKEKTEQDE